MIEHVNSPPVKTATTGGPENIVKQKNEVSEEENDDNLCSFESGYGDSLKKHLTQHVVCLNKIEKKEDSETTTKTRSQLLLEEFDSDGNYIGGDSETEESAQSEEEEDYIQ